MAMSVLLIVICSGQLAWTNKNNVEIQADRSSDGQKMIVVKEQSDLRIACEITPPGSSSVEWTMNTHTTLTTGTDRVEMSQRNTTVNGQLTTLHTLIIRQTSTMDIGTYECRSDSELDRVYVNIARLAKLQIIEEMSELQLKEVNGTYVDLTLRCVGELKSRPAWKHNGTIVGETMDTVLNTVVNRTSGRQILIMTRRDVTERFAGHYQCVDTAFFQSDSDILTIHADAPIKSQSARKRNGTEVSNQASQLLLAAVLLVTTLLKNHHL